MRQRYLPLNVRMHVNRNWLYQGTINDFMGDFTNYKLNFEELWNCVAYFDEFKSEYYC